jgi:hypothetical protein
LNGPLRSRFPRQSLAGASPHSVESHASRMKSDSTIKSKFRLSIGIEMLNKVENAELSMNSTFLGTVMALRAEYKKSLDSIHLKHEPFSSETGDSHLQLSKRSGHSFSTVRGILMDLREERENALDSLNLNRESNRKENDERDRGNDKHDEQWTSTSNGRATLQSAPRCRINFVFNKSRMKHD